MSTALAGCALSQPLPKERSLQQRLSVIPRHDLPLRSPVFVRWDDHQIPFIEAQHDDDAAFALGLVHAHLRLGQMAIYRRIAQGRIAEMGGPLAADIDHGIRILDFGRAAARIEASLPKETRVWLERFVEGINIYQDRIDQLPLEYSVLGLKREPWTVRDVLTFGRLAGTDVTWLVWFNFLQLRQRPDWPEIWTRLTAGGSALPTERGHEDDAAALGDVLNGLSRSGSNSLAIAGNRTSTGAALMANDPHLGINLPNTWLIAGLKSPSYNVVGLMVPGLPIFAIGRNPWIAWGGTNMRATASDLVDVSHLPEEDVVSHKETIGIRWWPDREVEIRDTPWGPVLTDAPQLAELNLPPLALRWTGHDVSDEITALLGVARARNFDSFRSSLATFGVSGQNMLYADRDGNIGMVMAVRVPDRSGPVPEDMVIEPAEAQDLWSRVRNTAELPVSLNPEQGFLASANNRPTLPNASVGYFFSPDDRVTRMAEIIGPEGVIDITDLKTIHRDVYVASSVQLRDVLVSQIQKLDILAGSTPEERIFVERIAAWDGHYRPESTGAVAFELFHHAFTTNYYKSVFGDTDWAAFAGVGQLKAILVEDIEAMEPQRLANHLSEALTEAAPKLENFANWGEMHRLGLRHPLHFIPLMGDRFRFADHPIGGSSDALMKTAHALTDQRHYARYGSNARHISDLSNLDANLFVLLGGQDGWFNSSTFIDQSDLWLEGEYIQMPLSDESVRNMFPHRTELIPTQSIAERQLFASEDAVSQRLDP
ncbi:MAG: penicillin acylase family protein [Hyphomicrobiales bacterium]|nr:penicillin acylase family protein [Hyphomicrobiales bacterium]